MVRHPITNWFGNNTLTQKDRQKQQITTKLQHSSSVVIFIAQYTFILTALRAFQLQFYLSF